ncbi:MAG: hypothetical protein GX189_07225 [Clostridiales bacterium]|nr:hypothetical protein [Clostridiales bacterium]
MTQEVLKNEEKAMLRLRALYRRYGYAQYKMSKFEEYDLYARNKNFLPCDYVVTFNEPGGRLMALKPDVTLSIVRNTRGSAGACKYFYNENVYRLSADGREIRERMQAGLEYIGELDVLAMSEVIFLALKSLETISDRYLLDISHLGFVGGLLESLGLRAEVQADILRCISRKNAPEIEEICARHHVSQENTRKLTTLASLYGKWEDVRETLLSLCANEKMRAAVFELEAVLETVRALGGSGAIYIDFSTVNDMNYYNGIIFQGYVDGLPEGILSGGRYDPLLQQFGRDAGAIGFAVYLDLLEHFHRPDREYDVDVLLLYDEATPPAVAAEHVRRITESGESVRATRTLDENVKYRRLVRLEGGRAKEAGNA